MKNEAVSPPSSAEITRRLRIVTELRNLCLSLGRAKRASPPIVSRQVEPSNADTRTKHDFSDTDVPE